MSNLLVISLEATKGAGATPYIIGGGILLGLIVLMLITVAIGGGREHS
ncbi:MAG: hypothetical protein ACTHJM_07555 [Marmoricola sp.]